MLDRCERRAGHTKQPFNNTLERKTLANATPYHSSGLVETKKFPRVLDEKNGSIVNIVRGHTRRNPTESYHLVPRGGILVLRHDIPNRTEVLEMARDGASDPLARYARVSPS